MLSWCLNISLSILSSFGNSKSCWSLAILIFCQKKKMNLKVIQLVNRNWWTRIRLVHEYLPGNEPTFNWWMYRLLIVIWYNMSFIIINHSYYYHLITVIVLIDKNHLIVNGSLIYEHIYVFLSIHVIQDIKMFWEIIFLLLQQLYFLINVVWSECVVISNNFFSQHSKENNILYTLFFK